MKRLVCFLLAVGMLLSLAACGNKSNEPETKEWSRQGIFEDENGNRLFISRSETEEYEGWAVTLVLDGEPGCR